MTEVKLRKDAALNRARLLDAGREVFAERGLDATLNDVAHRAGVGVGTAYRRFANKEDLIDAIRCQQDNELEAILNESLATDDPWDALVHYLEKSIALHVADRGMAELLTGRRVRPEMNDHSRSRLAPVVNRVAERARQAGVIRADATGPDLIFIQIACISISAVVRDGPAIEEGDSSTDLYRRYLWVMLDGLKRQRNSVATLPVEALTTAQLHILLSAPITRPTEQRRQRGHAPDESGLLAAHHPELDEHPSAPR
ncbi:TetR/AcrR family transcriptional regulator [Agromyces sp. ISL-38]|uniref:TetR/AcrR family transcriptional regulator n=1 Tax=Agromyces sp. ISL-38 TaxID=2819107 RepID=UPI001BEAE12C|nr:TetR/AcrR family transcriptional regulator [Agromyces sp. ISL-38]MBT2498553.1 TetR/AcrR family transcriptional regulator [Agromyces sp. ISL-38]